MSDDYSTYPGYIATRRFLRDYPERFPVVKACVIEAQRAEIGFAGAWVLQEAQKLGVGWFPNLRSLASYGILQRRDVSRGGRRAYYTMPDIEGVKAALKELEISNGGPSGPFSSAYPPVL